MQRPKPPNQPVITVDGALSVGGIIPWFAITLLITAPDLDPDAVTAILHVEPTSTQRRAVPVLGRDGKTPRRIPDSGRWSLGLTPDDTDEWDVCEAIKILTNRISADLTAWAQLPQDAEKVLSIALDIQTFNQCFSLAPETARFFGNRNVILSFDIYNSATGEPGSAMHLTETFFATMERER